MDHPSPLSAPMMGRSRTFDDPYRPCEEEEEEFYDRNMYLAVVGALLYLSTYTRPDISFATVYWPGTARNLEYAMGMESSTYCGILEALKI